MPKRVLISALNFLPLAGKNKKKKDKKKSKRERLFSKCSLKYQNTRAQLYMSICRLRNLYAIPGFTPVGS